MSTISEFLILLLEAAAVFVASTILFDGLHFLLHQWKYSRIGLLRWAAGLHQVHHDFLDKQMNVHPEMSRANIWAHLVPEFLTSLAGTALFLPLAPAATVVALFTHIVLFAYRMAVEGMDPNHMTLARLNGRLPTWWVSTSYHALHHINPRAYYGSVVTAFDMLFGTALRLDGKRVTITGSGALADALARRLGKEGAWVRRIHHGTDYQDDQPLPPRTKIVIGVSDIVILAHGTRDSARAMAANCDLNGRIITEIMNAHRQRLVPPEVWGIGSEAELHGFDSYARSKRAFAAIGSMLYRHPDVTYRHIVPSSFRSGMSRFGFPAGWVAWATVFMAKRGFRYIPVTWTGIAFLNWFRFRYFAA